MNPNQRKKAKLSLFAHDILLYIEKPNVSTKNTIRINKFNKVEGDKN